MDFFPSRCLKTQIKLNKLKKQQGKKFGIRGEATLKLQSLLFQIADQLQQPNQQNKFHDEHIYRSSTNLKSIQAKGKRKNSKIERQNRQIRLNTFEQGRDIINQTLVNKNKSTPYNTPKNRTSLQRHVISVNYQNLKFGISNPKEFLGRPPARTKNNLLQMFRRTVKPNKQRNIKLPSRPNTSFSRNHQQSLQTICSLSVRTMYTRRIRTQAEKSLQAKQNLQIFIPQKIKKTRFQKKDFVLSPWQIGDEENHR